MLRLSCHLSSKGPAAAAQPHYGDHATCCAAVTGSGMYIPSHYSTFHLHPACTHSPATDEGASSFMHAVRGWRPGQAKLSISRWKPPNDATIRGDQHHAKRNSACVETYIEMCAAVPFMVCLYLKARRISNFSRKTAARSSTACCTVAPLLIVAADRAPMAIELSAGDKSVAYSVNAQLPARCIFERYQHIFTTWKSVTNRNSMT